MIVKRYISVVAAFFICVFCADGGECARLAFIGDVMAHDTQLEAARRGSEYDFSPQFCRILPLFQGSLVTANLETVLGGAKRKYTGYPLFNTPDSLADALADAGVDIVTIANNHILDRNESGLARTMEVLDASPLRYLGASGDGGVSPLIVDHEGVKIAFLNFTYGTNVPPNEKSKGPYVNYIKQAEIDRGLAAARAASPDLTVVCLHWGIEYVYKPRSADVATAMRCVDGGADLVIGTHPHVMQPIEVIERGGRRAVVAWSLGNFVSYQRTKPRERSIVLAIDVEKTEGGCELVGVKAAPTWVSARNENGRKKIEVMYAGGGGKFDHTGLPQRDINTARAAGSKVLEFLGARGDADEDGFYTIWDAKKPKDLPIPGRKEPM